MITSAPHIEVKANQHNDASSKSSNSVYLRWDSLERDKDACMNDEPGEGTDEGKLIA